MQNVKVLKAIIIMLAIALIAVAYKFTKGSVAPSNDTRIAVVLSKDERNLILKEMRNFLISVQGVSEAISNNDMHQVAKLSTEAGMKAEENAPGALLAKIPLEMKKLGFDTRQKFDQISADATTLKDPLHSRKQLDALMKNCIACHASYQLVEAK
ncbi:MAG: hypothetical protein HOP06_01505 [Methylotenera sp.]|nr:hypothetical protein [Methylotenera sp.]